MRKLGIDILDSIKTEKTITEMTLELNLNFTLSKAVEDGKERHMNIQSKAVKKRMKKQAKRSKALNRQRSGKKKSFFARIFTGK